MSISITIPGNPAPQERPRARAYVDPRTGIAKAQIYQRKGPTKNYRALIAHEAALAMNGKEPLSGPLELTIHFFLQKPKSKPKYKAWPDVRPDLDNYVKAVKDALKGIVYRDDAQVCVCVAKKGYALMRPPCTTVVINRLENMPRAL